MKLQGTAALVTGASRGLGAALARRLAAKGVKVAMVARDKAAVEMVARSIRESGGIAHAIAADVGDKRAVYAIAGEAAAHVGPIDIVVHNASTLGKVPLPLLIDTECEDLGAVLETNLVGPFRLTKAFVGSMLVRGRGVVVNISSDAAVAPYPHWGAYSASKAALDHLSRIWAAELEGTGVRVFAVDPGEMNTKMHADAIPEADPATLADPDAVAAKLVDLIEASDVVASGARIEAAKIGDVIAEARR